MSQETQWAYRLYDAQKLGSEVYLHGDPKPTRNQVAAVLHALADHTLNEHIIQRASFLGSDRESYGRVYSQATGLGRYFQQLGDCFEELPGLDGPEPVNSSTGEADG